MKHLPMEETTKLLEEQEQARTDRAHKRNQKKIKGMRRRQSVPNVKHTTPNIKVQPQ